MADANAKRRAYPYMSTTVWNEIRNRFRKSMPKQVTLDYLQSILGISMKAAQNILPQLKTVGLVDEDSGSPTPLANDFRDDQGYASACEAIISLVYPDALLEAHPEPATDVDGVANWFMRNAGTGEASAKSQARFLAMLSTKVPPDGAERKERRTPSAAAPSAAKPAKAAAKAAKKPEDEESSKGNHRPNPKNPAIHLDIQIHIAADASPAQIDAVFSSMARHLYDRE